MHSPTLPPLDAAVFLGLVTAHSRVPRQRSKPNRKTSLGLRLPSPRPRGRAVGFPVARPLVWGRGGRARSRRFWRSTGTAPAADPLGRIHRPASILGNRGCARGQTSAPALGAETARVREDGAPAGAVRGAPARCSRAGMPWPGATPWLGTQFASPDSSWAATPHRRLMHVKCTE